MMPTCGCSLSAPSNVHTHTYTHTHIHYTHPYTHAWLLSILSDTHTTHTDLVSAPPPNIHTSICTCTHTQLISGSAHSWSNLHTTHKTALSLSDIHTSPPTHTSSCSLPFVTHISRSLPFCDTHTHTHTALSYVFLTILCMCVEEDSLI